MSHQAREAYLDAQVRSATPQQLRLMLIDGCLQRLRQARQRLDEVPAGQWAVDEQLGESLAKARRILSELWLTFRPIDPRLAESVRALYAFLLQHLTRADRQPSPGLLDEAIAILDIERETWRQLCEKEPLPPSPDALKPHAPTEILAATPAASAGTPSSLLQLEA